MSAGHRSISSEEMFQTLDVGPPVQSKLRPLIEEVPGYRPVGLAGTSPDAAPVVVDRTATLDAAMISSRNFGTLEVIGSDDRRPIPNPSDTPWRRTCALRILTRTNRRAVGTGWFIGPRTVMTAGHCVFFHDEGGWAQSIEVIPALDGNQRPFDSAVSNRFRAVDGWVQDEDEDFDYAAIILNTSLGDRTGWFGFSALNKDDLQRSDANISGYPRDLDSATRQYFHARRITRVTPRKIFYDIDTTEGQSGSCVWLLHEGMRVAIGVHTRGDSSANFGTRIDEDVFNNMARWKQES
jgi:glutamyl endopeptidase